LVLRVLCFWGGIVLEVTFRPTDRGWCKPSQGAKYADYTLKVFRSWFGQGLRHIRLPNGRILTKYDWIDAYLKQFEVQDGTKEMAEELVSQL
jgi:hypothetical protein